LGEELTDRPNKNTFTAKLIPTFQTFLSTLNLPLLKISKKKVRHWWLTPIILATQEAESGRTVVTQGQLGQNVSKILSQPIMGTVA
jgi:hypothetical protein